MKNTTYKSKKTILTIFTLLLIITITNTSIGLQIQKTNNNLEQQDDDPIIYNFAVIYGKCGWNEITGEDPYVDLPFIIGQAKTDLIILIGFEQIDEDGKVLKPVFLEKYPPETLFQGYMVSNLPNNDYLHFGILRYFIIY